MSEIHREPLQQRDFNEHEPESQGREEDRAPAKIGPAREPAAGSDRQQDEEEHQPREDAQETPQQGDALFAFGSDLGGMRRAAQNVEGLEKERTVVSRR